MFLEWIYIAASLKQGPVKWGGFLLATKLLPYVLFMGNSFQHFLAPCLSLFWRAGHFSRRTPSLLGVLIRCHWMLLLQELSPLRDGRLLTRHLLYFFCLVPGRPLPPYSCSCLSKCQRCLLPLTSPISLSFLSVLLTNFGSRRNLGSY